MNRKFLIGVSVTLQNGGISLKDTIIITNEIENSITSNR